MKKLKQWATIFATVMLVLLLAPQKTLFVSAAEDDIASGTSNDVTWVIDANGKLTVSGTGDFYEYDAASNHDFNIPWGFCKESIKSAVINVTGMTHAEKLFWRCANLESVDLSGFDTSNITDMSRMFSSCVSLTELDLSHFDTSNVTDMHNMFHGCANLTELDLSAFDTSNVTDMSNMFSTTNLTELDLSHFNTSNVTNMGAMFSACSDLIKLDLSGFDTSNVTNMSFMFLTCRKLAELNVSHFNTSNVTDMSNMFSLCSSLTKLDLSNFDTSKVTNMEGMFRGYNPTELDLSAFDTSNVTDMSNMFEYCINLTELDLSRFNTSNVTDMRWMFLDCTNLTKLDLSSFDVSNVTQMSGIFDRCYKVTSMNTPRNLKIDAGVIEFGSEGYSVVSWHLPDGTRIYDLPKNLDHSILITRRDVDNGNSDNSDNNNNNGGNSGSTGDNNNDQNNTGNGTGNNGSNNNQNNTGNGTGNDSNNNNNEQSSGTSGILEGTGDSTGSAIYGSRKLTVVPTTYNTLMLSWDAVPNAKSYEIFYSTSPDTGFKRLANVNAKKTTYKFSKAKCGVTYYFQMRVCQKGTKSAFGPISYGSTALTSAATLQIKKTTYNSVTISWNKVPGAKRYEIFCADSLGNGWTSIGVKSGTRFTHKKLVTGATYYYQIRPIRDSFSGSYSNGVSATTSFADVLGLKVKASSTDQLKLSWKKVKGATQYIILRSAQIDGTYEQIGYTNKISYVDTGLSSGTTYFYKVYAVSGPYRTKETAPVGQTTKIVKN